MRYTLINNQIVLRITAREMRSRLNTVKHNGTNCIKHNALTMTCVVFGVSIPRCLTVFDIQRTVYRDIFL